MHILIVDDEALARSRLRTLLGDCAAGHAVTEAAHAADAMAAVQAACAARQPVDAVLLDIHMPGQSGLALAHQLRALPAPPAIVFVTAHADHAVSAFELDAVDYLTKPVRLERLQQALAKVQRSAGHASAVPPAPPSTGEALVIQDRGRTERVPLADVLVLKAEQKYVTVRTGSRSYILDASLAELEVRHAAHFLRVHRNALVARRAMRSLEKHYDAEEGEGWALRLHGLAELVAVSRRQVAAVREVLAS
ncbi:LytTR family DNA-binding domain-containing protein [Acidovorax sp. Leaf160]|uniref:LytR/AlgR family response regulator transcription factor n=1 Tax=Acidovorax sp. Leaf160 TaxID=1736280 RepID=UPI0006F67CCD|nr:LytTR family DNA-binding domain-containing protein [Acidovorax sp. Leaf160]KQR50246.1 LytTR family transcriptional regulator [Acidovorax sp. Leaf160]